jgi:hypothetical protein
MNGPARRGYLRVERLSLSASSTSEAVSQNRDLASKLKSCETESTSAAVILLSKEKLRLSEFANSLSRPNLEGIFLDRCNGTLKGEACCNRGTRPQTTTAPAK